MFRCLYCPCQHATPYRTGLPDRFLRTEGTFDLVRCTSCGVIQLSDPPADPSGSYSDYRLHSKPSRLTHIARKLLLSRSYPVTTCPVGHLLDIGCGDGWFLLEMQRRGWTAEGVEQDPQYAQSLSECIGLPVSPVADFLARDDEGFDLITFNFSLEHVAKPLQLLAAAAATLRPHGRLWISLPNIHGKEARVFSDRWFHLDPPRHVSFPTPALLRRLLDDLGFASLEMRDLSLPTGFAGSLCYLTLGTFHPAVFYAALLPGFVFSAVIHDGLFSVTATKANHV